MGRNHNKFRAHAKPRFAFPEVAAAEQDWRAL